MKREANKNKEFYIESMALILFSLPQNTFNDQIAYTILYGEDVTKKIGFYEKAFGFKQKFITPENFSFKLLLP
jgi:hypothetical protein